MKLFKFGLRIWITLSSIFVFITSWIVFGHSPKPVSSNSVEVLVTPLPTLAPLPPMNGTGTQQQQSSGFSFFSLFNSNNNTAPQPRTRFITRGS